MDKLDIKILIIGVLAICMTSCAPGPVFTPTTIAYNVTPEISIPTAPLAFTPIPSISTVVRTIPTEQPIPTATSTSTPIPSTPTIAPTLSPSPVVDVADLPQTKIAVDQFAAAMKLAGIQVDAEQIRQGLSTVEMTGVDERKHEIVITQDGYPLMMKANGGEWKINVLSSELGVVGLGLGMVYDSHNNPFASPITLSPRNDELIRENATLLNSTEGFYWSKIFWDRNSGIDQNKQDWAWADEYIDFLRANNIHDAAPRIIDPLDNYYNAWLLDLARNSSKGEETKRVFSNILQTNITQIVRHSKAVIHSWTVNEILDDVGGMRDNVWMRTIGEDYVRMAILAIRKEDPDATVVLNDYYLEVNRIKNNKMVEVATQLMNDGVLKAGDIIGIEGHRSVLEDGITTDKIKSAARPFVQTGLRVRITELDAFDVFSNDANSQTNKANLYMKYIQAAIELNDEYRILGKETSVVDAVVILATTHSESWMHYDAKYKNKTIYPALFSDEGYPELAYFLVARDVFALTYK